MKQILDILLLALVVAATSCSLPGSNSRTVAARKTYQEGIGIGVVGGAVAGAIIGNAVDRKNGALVGGIVGAISGGVLGNMWADNVTSQRERFASEENYLDARIKHARKVKQSSRRYNAVLASEIQRRDNDQASIQGAINDSRAVERDLQHQIDAERRAVAEAQAKGGSTNGSRELQAEIERLEIEKAQISSNIAKLVKKSESRLVKN